MRPIFIDYLKEHEGARDGDEDGREGAGRSRSDG
jgi:hypothetical protein